MKINYFQYVDHLHGIVFNMFRFVQCQSYFQFFPFMSAIIIISPSVKCPSMLLNTLSNCLTLYSNTPASFGYSLSCDSLPVQIYLNVCISTTLQYQQFPCLSFEFHRLLNICKIFAMQVELHTCIHAYIRKIVEYLSLYSMIQADGQPQSVFVKWTLIVIGWLDSRHTYRKRNNLTNKTITLYSLSESIICKTAGALQFFIGEFRKNKKNKTILSRTVSS